MNSPKAVGPVIAELRQSGLSCARSWLTCRTAAFAERVAAH